MELLSPNPGLIIWSFLSLTNLVLCITAIIKMANDHYIEPGKKLLWMLAIILIPFIGALTCIAYKKRPGNKEQHC